MDHSRRRFLALAGLVGAAATLPSCGSTLAEPDVTAAGFGEGATGTVHLWCRAATQAGVQVTVDAFHASQDRITVEVTPVIDGQYVTKLATAIRGRSVPDLVDIDDINSMLFIYRDAFTDLTPLIDALPYAAQLSPGHLGLATRNGRSYAVPYLADDSVLWYNTDLLDRAGVDPERLTDLDSLLDAASKVRGLGDDVYGWSVAANSPGILGFVVQPHVWAADKYTITGEVGEQSGNIVGNEAIRTTFEFYRTMWTEGLMPRANFADSGSTWGADFRAGTIGLFPSSYGAVVPASEPEALARTGVRLLPGPSTGQVAFFDGGDNMGIPRGARNASAAWEFVKFALDLPQQQQLPAGGYTPVRSDAATDSFREQYPLAVPPLDQIDAGYAPKTLAYNLLYNQPDSPWIGMFRRAVFDGDVDGALEQGQQVFDRILDQSQL